MNGIIENLGIRMTKMSNFRFIKCAISNTPPFTNFYLVYSLKQRLKNIIFHISLMRKLRFRDTSDLNLILSDPKSSALNQLPRLSRYITWNLSINCFHIFISLFGSVMLIDNNKKKILPQNLSWWLLGTL